MTSYENTTIKKMNYNGQKVKKWYHDGVKVFTAGNVVTYYFNPSDYAQEEVDSEASVLAPKTVNYLNHFSGWTFVGWREDKTASSSVLSSKVMGDEPITLYAVYKRTLTASFNGNGATSGSVASISGTQYHNNGNIANPTITLPACGYARTDYKFTGWNYGAVGAKITLTGNITVSAQWTYMLDIVISGVLQSGISRSIVDFGKRTEYPNNVTARCYMASGDEDTEYAGWCTQQFNHIITGNGTLLYVKVNQYLVGGEYGLARCGFKVQLVNIDTNAITVLGAYNEDANSGTHDGVMGNYGVYHKANNALITYRLPNSGRYYLQIRSYVPIYGSYWRSIDTSLVEAYSRVG